MDTVSIRSVYGSGQAGRPYTLANACRNIRSWWHRSVTYKRSLVVHGVFDVATLEGEGRGMSAGNSEFNGLVRGIPQPVKSGHQGSLPERRQVSRTGDGPSDEGVIQDIGRRYDDLHAEMRRKVSNATDCLEGIIKSMVG